VGSRRKPADIGAERGRYLLDQLIREATLARRDRGLTLAELGAAIGITGSMASRIETRSTVEVGFIRVSSMLSVVGLEMSARAFPGGSPVRTRGHDELLARFRGLLHSSIRWGTEVPMPIRGDLRAWDGLIRGLDWAYGVEVETHPTDGQGLIRRIELKVRDSGVSGAILVVPRTRHVREFIAASRDLLAAAFPIAGARALELLSAGVDPGGSAVVAIPSRGRVEGRVGT